MSCHFLNCNLKPHVFQIKESCLQTDASQQLLGRNLTFCPPLDFLEQPPSYCTRVTEGQTALRWNEALECFHTLAFISIKLSQFTTDVQDAQSAAKSRKTNQGVTWKRHKECFIWSDNYAWCCAILPEITTRQIRGIGVNPHNIASSYNFSHEPVQILINKLNL